MYVYFSEYSYNSYNIIVWRWSGSLNSKLAGALHKIKISLAPALAPNEKKNIAAPWRFCWRPAGHGWASNPRKSIQNQKAL